MFLQPLKIGFNISNVSFLDSHIEVAVLQITVDTICLYALANNLVPGPAQLTEYVFHIFAEMFRNAFFAGDSTDHLTTVATRCTPANFVCFNDMNVVAALDQVQCCRNAGKARADNADIRALFTLQRCEVCNVVDRGCVIRACVSLRFDFSVSCPTVRDDTGQGFARRIS